MKPQIHQTVVYDEVTELSAFVFTVPARGYPGSRRPLQDRETEVPEEVRRWIDEEQGEPAIVDEALVRCLGGGLVEQVPIESIGPATLRRLIFDNSKDLVKKDVYEFAEYLEHTEFIPFENSPLGAVSLDQVLRTSGTAIGAYAGFVIGRDTTLLLITVPAGMLVCGVASGVAHGLEETIRAGIGSWLGFNPPPENKADKRTIPKLKSNLKSKKKQSSRVLSGTPKTKRKPDDDPDSE